MREPSYAGSTVGGDEVGPGPSSLRAQNAAASGGRPGNRIRMPTNLERKLQEARKAFNRRLGLSADPDRPPSPGTLHKLLAKLETQERRSRKVRRSIRIRASYEDCARRAIDAAHLLSTGTVRTAPLCGQPLSFVNAGCELKWPGAISYLHSTVNSATPGSTARQRPQSTQSRPCPQHRSALASTRRSTPQRARSRACCGQRG